MAGGAERAGVSDSASWVNKGKRSLLGQRGHAYLDVS